MKTDKQYFKSIALTTLLYTGFAIGSIAQDTNTIVNPVTKSPVILTTTPTDGEENVDLNSVIEITFNSEMDEATINESTLLLHANSMQEMLDDQIKDRSAIKDSENSGKHTAGAVNGTISYSNKVAVFTPNEELKEGVVYTFTVTNGVKSSENIVLENEYKWDFTTMGTSDLTYSDKQNERDRDGMEENKDRSMHTESTNKSEFIELGKAGQFVILAKTNINNKSESMISGHTGEGSSADSMKKEKDDSDSVRQKTPDQAAALQSNQSDTTSPDVSEAIEDMMSAYSDASTQNNGDDGTNQKNERMQSNELTPGVHEWDNSLHLESDVTLSGSEDDVWLIKVSDNLIIDENIVITLTDGALANNVFWYVEGEVTIGKNAHFEGVILSMNEITLEKGAKLNGRMFSQTSITLDDNTITEPKSIAESSSSTKK